MKVLLLNGSVHEKGCTYTALSIASEVLREEGIETEIINIGSNPIRDCIACGACRSLDKRCVFGDDIVNEIIKKVSRNLA